jgi:large subunit ribosomal protein L4
MPTVKVRNLKNKEVGEVQLSDAVFGAPLNEALIHAAVRNFMANARQGTSATKTRGDVSGAGRKLWKQKGTGRARIASLRSPLWKGGGNVHGPQPRDWSYRMPKKMRGGALRSALSERMREGNVLLIDALALENPKTKEFLAALTGLGLEGRTLIVDSFDNENLLLSARNVQRAKVVNSFALNIYDLLYHEKLLLSRAAAEELEQLLKPEKEAVGAEPDAHKSEAAASEEGSAPKPKRVAKPKVEAAPKGKSSAAKKSAPKTASKAKKGPAKK